MTTRIDTELQSRLVWLMLALLGAALSTIGWYRLIA
jgi:hypothetical protein